MRPLTDSSHYLTNIPKLREQMARSGYLFLKSLLSRDAVTKVHAQLARHVQTVGWLSANTEPEDCIANPANACVDPEPAYLQVLRGFNECFDFYALSHHHALIDLFERLLQDKILVHPKPLPRNLFPSLPEFTTPAHQDFPNIQGTEEVYTAWIPLMDCTNGLGGLQLAEASHTKGVYEFSINNGAGGIEVSDPLTDTWVGGELLAGDVLIFHSMLVHKGIENLSNKLRMSFDARYQRVSDPFNFDNAQAPYGAPDSWEEMYATWPDTPQAKSLQFYWRELNLTEKPFDPHWFNLRDELAMTLGEQGDIRAKSVLQRIVARDTDAEKVARATNYLKNLPGS